MLPVSGNDLFDDRQSETGAFLVFAAGAVDLIETFPDLVDAGFRDPDAMVLDGNKDLVVFLRRLDRDRGMIRAELDRVAEKIIQYLLDLSDVCTGIEFLA